MRQTSIFRHPRLGQIVVHVGGQTLLFPALQQFQKALKLKILDNGFQHTGQVGIVRFDLFDDL
jgi:hypothetical protein